MLMNIKKYLFFSVNGEEQTGEIMAAVWEGRDDDEMAEVATEKYLEKL